MGQGARAAAHQGPREGRALALRRGRGRHRDRGEGDLGLRVQHRELVAVTRRGALPDGLQPRRDPTASRRDARAGGPGALGRSHAAAVEVGDPRAPGRRGADPAQRRPHAHDVRQLRRPRRARRHRPRDRPRGRGRPAQPGQDRRAHLRPAPLRPRGRRRRPGLAHLRGAAALQLHALAGGVQPSWSSPTSSGPTSTAGRCGRRSRSTPAGTAATAARSPTPASRSSRGRGTGPRVRSRRAAGPAA